MTRDVLARSEAVAQDVGPVGRHRRAGEPGWARPGLVALLGVTAVTYLWGLGGSGWANSYYAAAVQAGTRSWRALLFGSLDAGNFITVDKPPASLWVMGVSGRLFGFSSWSMLVPQALMGVASVALLYAAVRRWFGPGAGLAAGAVLAFTPVAVLMFRFNNPDALLVLLEVAAAYATVRAVDAAPARAGTRWLLLAGALVGLGFLTKMLQVVLVVPALAGVYLLAAEVGWRPRFGQLAAAGAAMVVSAGWYVALVQWWPASSRPYIGGSNGNSLWELALGYNGLQRILGGGQLGDRGAPPAGELPGGLPGGFSGGPPGFGGQSGLGRLFNNEFGGQISWLLPAALVVLVAGLWLSRRAPRTDRARAGLLLWGGWLLVTGLVFSFMSGLVHPYYTVAMAPGLAATVAVGAARLWARRDHPAARAALAGAVVATAAWSGVLLNRTPDFLPWLRWVVAGAGLVVGCALSVPPGRRPRAVAITVLVGSLLVGGGVLGYVGQTALTPHQGTVPAAGPSNGSDTRQPGAMIGGGPGLGADEVSANEELLATLRSAGGTWSAATVSGYNAAALELASGTSVMGIGGFGGADPAPTLERFTGWVAEGKVRYFVDRPSRHEAGTGDPGAGGPPTGGSASEITSWVRQRYAAATVGEFTVYDLSSPARPAAGS